MTDNQRAELSWWDGIVPVSVRFDDPYFSLDNGLAETEHVFLRGNTLPDRFRPGFCIAELGFGTGLNLLTAWRAWLESAQTGALSFTSFEAYPMATDDMARALAAFPELVDLAAPLLAVLAGGATHIELPGLLADIVIGDARRQLPVWQGKADAWFLDGFAPALNPELWQPDLMQAVADHTKKGGTFATYTAAGAVRRDLAAAGFEVARVTGFGRKRHMTIGSLR